MIDSCPSQNTWDAGLACTATTQLRGPDALESDPDVALSGRVFRGTGTLLLVTIRQHVHPIPLTPGIAPPNIEPVLGSLL